MRAYRTAALLLMLGTIALLLAPVLPACATEDSALCTWDAAVQGNGHGRSFVALWDDVVIYLP